MRYPESGTLIKSTREKMNRRKMLKVGGLTAAATVTPTSLFGHSECEVRNMRVSLAAYSVRQSLTSESMDLFDFIDWCSEMNLAGTELTSYYFEKNFDSAYLRRLRNRAFRQGVTVSGTAIRNDFCQPPGEKKDREVAQVKKWIDHAAELFAPHVRIFAGDIPEGINKETAIRWTADGIKEILGHAEARGIVIGLENHGGITAEAADLVAICEAVGDHPWFGINLDTGNYRSRDPYEELILSAPKAVNVQVKAFMAGPGRERVPADLERIRDILVDAGYKGWIVLEYEAKEPKKEIPKYIARLKELFEC
jgi:sugar phosphate isomerase/epimerase